MNASSFRFMWIPVVAGLTLVACGESPPPVAPSSGELPLKMSTATAAPLPPPSAEPAPTAEPSASAVASGKPAPPADTGSGRPPVLKMHPTEISDSFGISPGAKLELGTEGELAILRIPENAFAVGTNVTFKLDPKGKVAGALIGKIYRLTSVIPPAGEPVKIVTAGPPFQLQLPAGNKKDANLAIGEIGPAKINWKVIAPTKIDDVTGTAFFELTELGDLYLHVTTRAVTPAPK